ncbi:MAG: DMT family transporter [Anaerolineales bacterium]|nr:DMT family transporter [Anaerolineales bacterium]
MKPRAWLAFILLGAVWGSSFLWIKIALREVGPFTLVAIRLLFGILALWVAALISRPSWPREWRTWRNLTILGLFNNALPYLLISWGEVHIDSGVAAILNSTAPLFTMLIAHFLLADDRMSPTRLVALGMGFAGILILFSRDLNGGFRSGFAGQLAVLLATISYAGSSVFARKTTQQLSTVVIAMAPLLGADLIMWGVTPLAEPGFSLPSLPLTWLALAWLGVIGVALAYLLYFYLLHNVGPTRTILVTYAFPLIGVLLGVLFLGEALDWRLALGGGLVVASIVVVNRR